MELIVASAMGFMTAAAVYLILQQRTFPIVVGLTLLSYAVNIFLFSSGRLVVDGDLEALKRKTWGIYEVRVREETDGRFRETLDDIGMSVTEKGGGLLHVTMKENGTRSLFEAAKKAAAEIRHLERFEPTLEEVFLAAINPKKEDTEAK